MNSLPSWYLPTYTPGMGWCSLSIRFPHWAWRRRGRKDGLDAGGDSFTQLVLRNTCQLPVRTKIHKYTFLYKAGRYAHLIKRTPLISPLHEKHSIDERNYNGTRQSISRPQIPIPTSKLPNLKNSHIIVPHCTNLVPLVHFGLANFSAARRRYFRSSRNWCFGESLVMSGGHWRLGL